MKTVDPGEPEFPENVLLRIVGKPVIADPSDAE
jgi:hypothetical protein